MGAAPDGASWTAACACAGGGAAAGRGVAGAAGTAAADDGFGAAPSGGSGDMMLTGGVEAAVGNSALVGLPVGNDGGSAAIMPAAACGVFQDDA